MKPRTKTEKEVVRLSRRLPELSKRMKKRFVSQSEASEAFRFRGMMTDVQHFVVITTSRGWQVIRHFYMYAVYRYDRKEKAYRFSDASFTECMQDWFKDGEYVFMSLNRQQGCCNDAWCAGQPLTVKRGQMGGFILRDPRELHYNKAFYVRVSEKFRYLPSDEEVSLDVCQMYRMVNENPFWETMICRSPMMYLWCIRKGFTKGDRYKAMRVAWKRNYDFCREEWKDLVEMHEYLGHDIANPNFVCPDNFNEEHDTVKAVVERKKERLFNDRQRMFAAERRKRELEDKKRMIRLEGEYPIKRGMFFGIVLTDKDIEISVLRSIEDFMEEGKALSHCVFANAYYDIEKKPYCLILSAKVHGIRTETIEVDLKRYEVVQCRGYENENSPYHDKILRLINGNMSKIREINWKVA